MNQLLLECYLSGQISEMQWQQHLRESPELAAMYDEAVKQRVNFLVVN